MTLYDMPWGLVGSYLFLFGACAGSFVGVVVARLPLGQSVVRPRSRCDHCGTTLSWHDNVPILSFIALRGRCRRCGVCYGARSVLLEVLLGLLFVALGFEIGLGLQLVWWLVFASALMAIVFLDIDHFWVPDVITYPLMVWALLFALLPIGPGLSYALWGLLPALLLWAVAWAFERITGKEGMGLGDIKLLAALGLMMGLTATLAVLFLGSLQGAILGAIIIARGGHKERVLMPMVLTAAEETSTAIAHEDHSDAWQPDPKAVPFGPFLVLAAFEVLLYAGPLAQLFKRMLPGEAPF